MATKVSFGFGRLSDTELDNFAQGVIDAMNVMADIDAPVVRYIDGRDRDVIDSPKMLLNHLAASELFQSLRALTNPVPRALPWAGICERLRRC